MSEKNYQYDVVVYIGRFQPFHTGHLALVRQALAIGKKVVIVLGSAGEPSSLKNPLSAAAREAMIQACIVPEDAHRVLITAVADTNDMASWVADVHDAVARKAPGAASVALLGHFKDDSSYYLRDFPDWHLESVGRANELDATTVRNVMFDGSRALAARLADMQSMVPAGALEFLEQWMMTDPFRALEKPGAVSTARALETAQT
jgi:bifunctional NMN adenylyltransferase/nudix hydrolase